MIKKKKKENWTDASRYLLDEETKQHFQCKFSFYSSMFIANYLISLNHNKVDTHRKAEGIRAEWRRKLTQMIHDTDNRTHKIKDNYNWINRQNGCPNSRKPLALLNQIIIPLFAVGCLIFCFVLLRHHTLRCAFVRACVCVCVRVVCIVFIFIKMCHIRDTFEQLERWRKSMSIWQNISQ